VTHRRVAAVAAVLNASSLAVGLHAFAQPLYKYKDARGGWVYSDHAPEQAASFEQLEIGLSDAAPEVLVLRRASNVGESLVGVNTFYGPVQIAYRITQPRNLSPETRLRGNRVLPPRSETELAALLADDSRRAVDLQLAFQYIHGEPGARHAPRVPYRLPFAVASTYRVSQAFPDVITHGDASSRHAIDFVMPVGTEVFAARGGTVLEVASDFYDSGQDPAVDLPRANIVRVLHEDGTLSLYAHLNWNSIRVRPGQAISRGEYIADSGNTGFTTGPHLHFVVQRNVGGAIESLPVVFERSDGRAAEVHSGDLVTAR
jgi:murein DD-endopeptidase MepM/ murein hydrolase activator NlpD